MRSSHQWTREALEAFSHQEDRRQRNRQNDIAQWGEPVSRTAWDNAQPTWGNVQPSWNNTTPADYRHESQSPSPQDPDVTIRSPFFPTSRYHNSIREGLSEVLLPRTIIRSRTPDDYLDQVFSDLENLKDLIVYFHDWNETQLFIKSPNQTGAQVQSRILALRYTGRSKEDEDLIKDILNWEDRLDEPRVQPYRELSAEPVSQNRQQQLRQTLITQQGSSSPVIAHIPFADDILSIRLHQHSVSPRRQVSPNPEGSSPSRDPRILPPSHPLNWRREGTPAVRYPPSWHRAGTPYPERERTPQPVEDPTLTPEQNDSALDAWVSRRIEEFDGDSLLD